MVHATPSVETLEALIGPPTFREFWESAPGRLQVVSAEVVGAGLVLGTAVLLAWLPVPQAAPSRLSAASKQNPRSSRARIRFAVFDMSDAPVGLRVDRGQGGGITRSGSRRVRPRTS